jgi:CubicO group peptidase (beta-lactamase class C family)
VSLLFSALLALGSAQAARIDEIVAATMRADHVAGLSLGIARRGVPLYLRGYGERDLARALPADEYTAYCAGSIAKQFTAALVMQQAAAGRIALEAPLSRYLPGAGAYAGVTVAQLLGQTSGIPSYTDRPEGELRALAGSNPSPQALLQPAAAAPPAFAPGDAWQYSNTNYLLLGTILERVASKPYAALLQNEASTLGLRSTAFGAPATGNAAQGYVWRDGFVPVTTTAQMANLAYAAGGLTSNVPDLLAWLEALRGGAAVSRSAFATMTSSVRLNDGVPAHYGYGFFIADWYGRRVAFAPGELDGFSGADAIVLDDGLELALLSNADRVDLGPLAKSVAAIADPPLERDTIARPAENENPAVTAQVRAIAATPAFAALGPLRLLEFVERRVAGAIAYDKYRLTFASGQWWLTIGYSSGGAIESLSLEPDTE